MRDLNVGDIVKLKRAFLNCKENSIGYIYDTYTDFGDKSKNGVCILTEELIDLGGFSYEEQQIFLEYITSINFFYKFKSIIKLNLDIDNGLFDHIFELS